MVFLPKEREGVMVPMGVRPGILMGKRSYLLWRLSNFCMGFVDNESKLLLPCCCCCLIEVKHSGTCLRGPWKAFVPHIERGVVSTFWSVAQAPLRLIVSLLGVKRREVLRVETSYMVKGEEKL